MSDTTTSNDFKPGSISGDRWEGVDNHPWQIAEPSPTDLDHALQRLDAETFTVVTVAGEGEAHIGVGGGHGQYVVYATFDNSDFWNLLRRVPADGVIYITIGGQQGEYPARQIVDLEQARSAARVFLLQRQLDPTQTWERQE